MSQFGLIDLDDVESSLLHGGYGLVVQPADFAQQPTPRNTCSLQHRIPQVCGDLFPAILSQDGGRDQRGPFHLNHIVGWSKPLLHHGVQGRSLHGLNHTGLQGGQHLGIGQRYHLESKILVKLLGFRVTGRGQQLHFSDLIQRRGRFLGKEVDPTGIAPVQDLESSLLDHPFQPGCQSVSHIVKLLIGVEHHRNHQGGDCRFNP